MSDQVILVLSGDGANNAIRGMMTEFGNALSSVGLPVVQIAVEPAELQYAIDMMVRGEVRFALTWLGFGQDISVSEGPDGRQANVWEKLRVPLLKIHADHPAYFSDRHRDIPHNGVNLYMAREFAHFRRRWLRDARSLAALIPPWPMAPLARDKVGLAKRVGGALVFLKNGNSPLDLRKLWSKRLSPALAELLNAMADAIVAIGLRPGKLHIGEFAAEHVAQRGIEPDSALSLIPFFAAQLDDYLRRIKSEMIANALLDFPVVVQGSYWSHVDFRDRRARLVPGEDFSESHRVFADELGVIDMSPNIDSEPHDRVQRAAGSYSLVLTNAQGWIATQFPDFQEMTFEFEPDSIKARIADVLAHPDRYLELGVAFGERFREVHPMEAFARRIVELADLAALQCNTEKPSLQPFFVWPAPSVG